MHLIVELLECHCRSRAMRQQLSHEFIGTDSILLVEERRPPISRRPYHEPTRETLMQLLHQTRNAAIKNYLQEPSSLLFILIL